MYIYIYIHICIYKCFINQFRFQMSWNCIVILGWSQLPHYRFCRRLSDFNRAMRSWDQLDGRPRGPFLWDLHRSGFVKPCGITQVDLQAVLLADLSPELQLLPLKSDIEPRHCNFSGNIFAACVFGPCFHFIFTMCPWWIEKKHPTAI